MTHDSRERERERERDVSPATTQQMCLQPPPIESMQRVQTSGQNPSFHGFHKNRNMASRTYTISILNSEFATSGKTKRSIARSGLLLVLADKMIMLSFVLTQSFAVGLGGWVSGVSRAE